MRRKRNTKTHFYDKVSSAFFFSTPFGSEGGEFIFILLVNRKKRQEKKSKIAKKSRHEEKSILQVQNRSVDDVDERRRTHCRNLLCRQLIGFFFLSHLII